MKSWSILPLYSTITSLYKDQHQWHKYVSEHSTDHLADDKKQDLETGLSFGGHWKRVPAEKRRWWVNVNWRSSFSNQEHSVWTWTRAKRNCHLLFFPTSSHQFDMTMGSLCSSKDSRTRLVLYHDWRALAKCRQEYLWTYLVSHFMFYQCLWSLLLESLNPSTNKRKISVLVSELVREQSTHFFKQLMGIIKCFLASHECRAI